MNSVAAFQQDGSLLHPLLRDQHLRTPESESGALKNHAVYFGRNERLFRSESER